VTAVAALDRGRVATGPGLSAAEIHAHTLASDGMVTSVDVVEGAHRLGLSVVCITDHDTIPGDIEAAIERGLELGVDVVRGQEITTEMRPLHGHPGVHILGLFLQRAVRQHMTIGDTVDAIHDEGGLALIPHPFSIWYFASMWPKQLRNLLQTHRFDGIEMRHRVGLRRGGWKELEDFYAENRQALGASLGAGDSHHGYLDLGSWVTLFPGKGAGDLRAAIENRTTSPQLGPGRQRPPVTELARQQVRSMIWLNSQRRRGLVGRGVGPRTTRRG
jgi:PHP domain